MKKLIVKWNDSYTTDKWATEADIKEQFSELLEISSIGFLLYQDDVCIVLCHSHDGENVNGSIHIPKCCVTKVTEINIE